MIRKPLFQPLSQSVTEPKATSHLNLQAKDGGASPGLG